jgi:hypothetical protein
MSKPEDLDTLGSCDDNGLVCCHLCTWRRACDTMEQIELFFGRHLHEVHQRKLLCRKAIKNGVVTEVPHDS